MKVVANQFQPLFANPVQTSGLNATDQKTGTVVRTFLSHALVGTSILSGSAFIVLSVAINPLWAVGIVPALVLATIGVKLAISPQAEAPKQFKPIGLINPGLDCWINSTFQLLANIPAFQAIVEKRVQDTAMHPLYELIRSYRKEQVVGKEIISSVLTREIGPWIYNAARKKDKEGNYLPNDMQPITSSDGSRQEEAGEFVKFFLEKCKGGLPIREKTITYEKTHPEKREESIKPVSDTDPLIILHPVETHSFGELWKSYFHYTAEHTNPLKENLLLKCFSKAPEDFTLEIKRFQTAGWDRVKQAPIAPRKITDAVDVPLELVLDKEQCPSEPFSAYECDGIIAHQSNSLECGHYVSYAKIGAQWWYMSDTIIKAVAEKEVAKELRKTGVIFHFSKKKQLGSAAV